MATESVSRWARIRTAAENFFHEKGIESEETFGRTAWQRFAHFCLMVFKSFQRNRCPVRASALAYTTLLALVPLLAVGMSITTSMLKRQGQEPIRKLIDYLVEHIAPALDLQQASAVTGTTASGREQVVEKITTFVSNISTGTLGVTGVLALLFVGISLLRTIEAAFNDIWGVLRGRSMVKSVVYYWSVITLGPLFLVGAFILTTGMMSSNSSLAHTQRLLESMPMVRALIFNAMACVVLSLGFAVFYALMPNTRVQWKAALVGGAVGGSLWQLNNLFNVVYVSRVISYTNLYGSLAVFPLFLVGLYFSWLIMLLGAQVAYAFQNREAYIEEKQAESVNQRGREFIALRMMTFIAHRFLAGQKPPTIVEISCDLGAPSALVSQLLGTFVRTGLLVEVADGEVAYSPARPINQITAHDVLRAMRAGRGIELATRDDRWRTAVRAEFEKMIDAERRAGASVTLEMLAQNQGEVARATA